ncbi:hypothetical protein HRbin12_01510 [bacterium HR12]|nr:hypothetical protein HRbin12_01510 [bacterium HR12]
MLPADERPDVGLLLPRVPLPQSPCELEEPLEERLGHRGLDQETGPGQAHLPCVVVLVHRLADRRLEVRVGEDEEGRLAPELERDRGEVGAGGRRDEPPRGDRPGERDPVHAGMGDEGRAGLLADPLDHVEGAVRQPRLPRDVGEERGREGRPLRRLQHHRVAGRQGRREPPGGQHEGRVPRRDDRRHARRVPGDALTVPLVDPLLPQPQQLVREEPQVPRHPRDDRAPHRPQERPVVAGLHGRQALHVRLDPIGHPVEDLRAPLRLRPAPDREGLARGPDGGVDLGRAAPGHLRDHPLVDGRHVLEGRGRSHTLPRDPVLGGDGDALDDGVRHRSPPASARCRSFGPER